MTKSIVAGTIGAAALVFGCSHPQPAAKPQPPPLPLAPPRPREQPPAPVPVQTARPSVDSIYFAFDAALLTDEARPILQGAAELLKSNPQRRLRIEGHCDERGTTEYNLVLGESRARAAKKYLSALGIAEGRVEIRSYGNERPRDPGHDEAAWAKNRRDDFVVDN